MGPLFIPKHDPQSTTNEDDEPHHVHHHHHHRSTPEGQEPERTEEQQPKKNKHRFSFAEYSTGNSALRKYVVLLQDCAAIRFVRERKQQTGGLITIPQFTTHASSSLDWKQQPPDGVALFKSFVACNKSCYWNPLLLDAVNSLEYKGCVHPSTILVCTTSHHMSVLRSAWSRRIVRDPPGFTAEFLGEVEELVAQPVQQGQFAPLSDSLCWVIADLTSEGREAFINSIQWSLNEAFPCISPPPKDLIFQTLEKLIREQKIYQTSRGYFIVTPEIHDFISYSRSVTPANIYGGRTHSDHLSISTPWGSTPSVALAAENLTSSSRACVRRHNSLRIVSSRTRHDTTIMNNNPSMGTRSLSFRLSKCNSLFESDKESDDNDTVEKPVQNNPQQRNDKKPHSSSFFTRLFTFRCTSKRKTVQTTQTADSPPTHSNPPRRHRASRRRVPEQGERRSTSPCSSASGIYASISNSSVTKRSSRRGASMYELRNWESKHNDNSDDVSR